MNTLTVVPIGSKVTDAPTGLKGSITHIIVELGGNTSYMFQQQGLNKDTQLPFDGFWIPEARMEPKVPAKETLNIPVDVLGSLAKEPNSGFTGTVTSLIMHTNGCVHAGLQSKGLKANGERIEGHD